MKSLLAGALMLSGVLPVAAGADERVPQNRVVYEVFVRNFSPEGNFKGVEAQVPRLKDLGIDVVWLMPIYKLGDIGKWGAYSSPYAIKDYTKVDPDNGTEQELRELITAIHDAGMEVWFDWVGNHTAMDNVWVESHPEFYTHKDDGSFIHPFNGAWRDVYELDRDSEAMQDEMIRAMQYWVDNFDIDGYRCDYASGPSPELWRKASERVLKDGKRIAWLAEDSAVPALVKNGYFDYNYAWEFQERFLKGFTKNHDLDALRAACLELSTVGTTGREKRDGLAEGENPYEGRSRLIYLINHDVVQDQGGTEDVVYGKYARPLTVLYFTVYGMPLLYNGQEIAYSTGGRVPISEKTPIDWSNPDPEMSALIKKLIELKHTQSALRTADQAGELTNLVTTADTDVYAYRRTLGDDNVVVMINFAEEPRTFTIESGLPEGVYTDALGTTDADFSKTHTFTLQPLNSAVFVKKN